MGIRKTNFRAWNKLKKIMCYTNEDNNADYWDGVKASVVELLNSHFDSSIYEFMQYTGLKDKNGKKIYDGDILGYDGSDRQTRFVIFDPRNAMFKMSYTNSYTDYYEPWECRLNYIVIGNIYENTELIEYEI